jgi:hypothetical protein
VALLQQQPFESCDASIDLYWRPFGAAGAFVRLSGLLFEDGQARVERSRPLDLYHAALGTHVGYEHFVIEVTTRVEVDQDA